MRYTSAPLPTAGQLSRRWARIALECAPGGGQDQAAVLTVCRAAIEAQVRERKFGFVLERAVLLTVLHRLMVSGSDRAADKWRADYAVDGVPARRVAEAMAAMVEQCAYVWFAQEAMNEAPMSVDSAADVVAGVWYRAFFAAKP